MTTRHGLDNYIALSSVLAVHVLRLRYNARDEEIRQQPARLHEEELKVQLVARNSKHPDWRQMTVWEFYVAVARMGDYVLNPKKNPPAGSRCGEATSAWKTSAKACESGGYDVCKLKG